MPFPPFSFCVSQTELCATFSRVGSCPYGHKCQFAHGVEELRARQVTSAATAVLTKQPLALVLGTDLAFASCLAQILAP